MSAGTASVSSACWWTATGGDAGRSALVQATVEWARDHGLHKLSLEVFAHNSAAIALYRKYGFMEEGRRIKQYRRDSGELWDSS